jgi:methionyl-tRNA formyltransferase
MNHTGSQREGCIAGTNMEPCLRFGRIGRITIFGGAPLTIELARCLKQKPYEVVVFSARRQLDEPVSREGETLEHSLRGEGIKYFCADDIGTDLHVREYVDCHTLGLGVGECWTFPRDLIELFGGRLLDFMGIPLPRYRGGAHYTWQILRGDRTGACNLQIINEQMVPGEFDSGAIVKSKQYVHPDSARTPQDYFDSAVKQEVAFLLEFLSEVAEGKEFSLSSLREDTSMLFPRLNTMKHGFINWTWKTQEIERFICAFDDPYAGASTFLQGKRVFLKHCSATYSDGAFHPFQAGLIYRTTDAGCYIAASDGSLLVRRVVDQHGDCIRSRLKPGDRFHTPLEQLEFAMSYAAQYDSKGLKNSGGESRRPGSTL